MKRTKILGWFMPEIYQMRNKYLPHQGKRECARRVRGHHPESKPRRMWVLHVYLHNGEHLINYAHSRRATLARSYLYTQLPSTIVLE